MSKSEKLVGRLLSNPKDFTWDELIKVLRGFGFEQITSGKTGGSRMRFIHRHHPPIIMHKPHPKNILKSYQLEQIIELLEQEKLL